MKLLKLYCFLCAPAPMADEGKSLGVFVEELCTVLCVLDVLGCRVESGHSRQGQYLVPSWPLCLERILPGCLWGELWRHMLFAPFHPAALHFSLGLPQSGIQRPPGYMSLANQFLFASQSTLCL